MAAIDEHRPRDAPAATSTSREISAGVPARREQFTAPRPPFDLVDVARAGARPECEHLAAPTTQLPPAGRRRDRSGLLLDARPAAALAKLEALAAQFVGVASGMALAVGAVAVPRTFAAGTTGSAQARSSRAPRRRGELAGGLPGRGARRDRRGRGGGIGRVGVALVDELDRTRASCNPGRIAEDAPP